MLIAFAVIEIILTLLLIVVFKRFLANKNEIEILFRKLIFLNKELKNADRISTEKLNQQSFDATGMNWSKFKFPFLLINKKKFTCKTYQSAAQGYTAYLRPVSIVFLVWYLNLLLILWKLFV